MLIERRVGSIAAVKQAIFLANLLLTALSVIGIVLNLFKPEAMQFFTVATTYVTIKYSIVLCITVLGIFGAKKENYWCLYVYSSLTLITFLITTTFYNLNWKDGRYLMNRQLLVAALGICGQLLLCSISGGLAFALHYEYQRHLAIKAGYMAFDHWRGRVEDIKR